MILTVFAFRLTGTSEGADRDNADARRRHPSAVRVTRWLPPCRCHAGPRRWRHGPRAVTVGDRASEIWLVEINLGIDHRDDDLVAVGDAVRIGELELVDDVLCRIACVGIGIVRIAGLLIARILMLGSLILREREGVNRLHGGIDSGALDRANHLTHGLPIADAQCVDGATQDADGSLRLNGQPETLRDSGDLLRRRAGADLHRHFARREPRFADGRHA